MEFHGYLQVTVLYHRGRCHGDVSLEDGVDDPGSRTHRGPALEERHTADPEGGVALGWSSSSSP